MSNKTSARKTRKLSRMGLPTLKEVTAVVRNILQVVRALNERTNHLAKSQLEMTIVLNALRKKGLLEDADVQEAWDEFQAQFDEDPKDPQDDLVESEGQDAGLGSLDPEGSGVLHVQGSGDAVPSEAGQGTTTEASSQRVPPAGSGDSAGPE